MSDTASAELPALPRPGASPRVVRDALHPEYREAFDRAFRQALDRAAQELDLTGVHDTIEHWRRRAWVTRDRDQHRRMVRQAVETLTGEAPPEDEPVETTEAHL